METKHESQDGINTATIPLNDASASSLEPRASSWRRGPTEEDAAPRVADSNEAAPVPPPTAYCYMVALIACLNSMNLGYDVGSVGGAALLMQEDLGWDDWHLGIFVGSINFFSIAGALNAGLLCDWIGRRLTFVVSSAIFITGILIQVLSPNFGLIMVGRLFVGMGVGLGLAIDPMLISELAPPCHRGHLASLSEVFINLGIMLGFIADYALIGLPLRKSWRLMLGLGVVMPSILIVLILTVMPESPRWLVLKHRKEEAIAVLRKTYPEGYNMEHVVENIDRLIEEDLRAKQVGWSALFCPSPPVRLMLLAGVGIAACQQASGTESLVYFSPELLTAAGFTSRVASFRMTIFIGVTKMAFVLISVFRADKYGRRTLVLVSTTGILLSLVGMALVAPYNALSAWTVAFMCTYMGAFSMAMGPLCWVACSEVFSTRLRAKAMSLATSTNRAISGLVAVTTIPMTKALTARGYFLFYAGVTVLSLLYLYTFLPETKGKTLEEVEEYFIQQAEKKWGHVARDDLIVDPAPSDESRRNVQVDRERVINQPV